MLHVTCALGKPLWISPKGEYFTEALLPDVSERTDLDKSI